MYQRRNQGWLKHLDFIVLDLVCLYLSLVLAYLIRMESWNLYDNEGYGSISVVILLADVAVAMLFDTFKNVLKRGYYKEFVVTVKHACLVEAVIIVYLFTIHESATYSRIVICLMGMLYVIISYCARLLWKRHLKKTMETGGRRSLLIVTADSRSEEVLENILKHNYEQFRLEGVVIIDCDRQGQDILGVPVIATAENAADYVCRKWVDEVLISLPSGEPYPEELVSHFLEMGVVVHRGLFEELISNGRKQFVERLGNYTVLTTTINYATSMQQFIKRTIDIVGGLFGCLITCILFLFLAPAIYISSPGPIFFVQERVGRNGRHFKMYKFRSMYVDAETSKQNLMEQNRYKDGMLFKLESDPRIIGSRVLPDGTVKKGLGNYMRDLSLDEFPQFFNVLKGDMSLVGTRPPTVDEWEKYDLHHRARLATRPGITGLWQVSGRNNIVDFEDVVKLDIRYITEWSIWLDLKILLQTVKVVLGKDGAM